MDRCSKTIYKIIIFHTTAKKKNNHHHNHHQQINIHAKKKRGRKKKKKKKKKATKAKKTKSKKQKNKPISEGTTEQTMQTGYLFLQRKKKNTQDLATVKPIIKKKGQTYSLGEKTKARLNQWFSDVPNPNQGEMGQERRIHWTKVASLRRHRASPKWAARKEKKRASCSPRRVQK